MRLLVSVADPEEARAAVDGGADIIDAKDPSHGALSPVTLDVLRTIVAAVDGARPMSAALGEIGGAGQSLPWRRAPGSSGSVGHDHHVDPSLPAAPEADGAPTPAACAHAGVDFIKLGFAEGVGVRRATALGSSLMRVLADSGSTPPSANPTAGGCAVVLAAYADAGRWRLGREAVLDVAAQCGVRGVLLDTLDKRGRGLFTVAAPETVAAWVDAAHDAGLLVGIAGSLAGADLALVHDVGADLAGVRGAACEGGRRGRVSSARVRALVATVEAAGGRPGAAVGMNRPETSRR
jgi:(5-formylfuran-3-yl)methyl phosphate synthase